jgi:O-antigen ligase
MATVQQPRLSIPDRSNSLVYGNANEIAKQRNLMLHLTMLGMYGVIITIIDGNIEWALKYKLASRAFAMGLLIFINLTCISRTPIRRVLYHFRYLILFLAFAAGSASWSALPSHSLKQTFSLALMILFSMTVARLVKSPRHVSIVFAHLTAALLLRAVIMLVAFARYGTGAFTRGKMGQFWHATDVADTAALGLLVIVVAYFIGKYEWSKLIWVPIGVVFGVLTLLAQNRLSVVLTPAMILVVLMMTSSKKIIFWGAFAVVCILPIGLVTDAVLGISDSAASAAQALADRDATGKSIWSFSGRDELWAVIWQEFKNAKLKGHGFMVSSARGEFIVWYELNNWDAHNAILQLLVSTGLIGLSLFILSCWAPTKLVLKSLFQGEDKGRLARAALVFGIWLFFWGLLNVSCAGYINSSQFVFYSVIGVVVGRLKQDPSSDDKPKEPAIIRV